MSQPTTAKNIRVTHPQFSPRVTRASPAALNSANSGWIGSSNRSSSERLGRCVLGQGTLMTNSEIYNMAIEEILQAGRKYNSPSRQISEM